jgi:hypothetical protein
VDHKPPKTLRFGGVRDFLKPENIFVEIAHFLQVGHLKGKVVKTKFRLLRLYLGGGAKEQQGTQKRRQGKEPLDLF